MLRGARGEHHQGQLQQGGGHPHPVHRRRRHPGGARRGRQEAHGHRLHTRPEQREVRDAHGVHPEGRARKRHRGPGADNELRLQHLLHKLPGRRQRVPEVQDGPLRQRYGGGGKVRVGGFRALQGEHPGLQQLRRGLRQLRLLQLIRILDIQVHGHLRGQEEGPPGLLQHGHAEPGREGAVAALHVRRHREARRAADRMQGRRVQPPHKQARNLRGFLGDGDRAAMRQQRHHTGVGGGDAVRGYRVRLLSRGDPGRGQGRRPGLRRHAEAGSGYACGPGPHRAVPLVRRGPGQREQRPVHEGGVRGKGRLQGVQPAPQAVHRHVQDPHRIRAGPVRFSKDNVAGEAGFRRPPVSCGIPRRGKVRIRGLRGPRRPSEGRDNPDRLSQQDRPDRRRLRERPRHDRGAGPVQSLRPHTHELGGHRSGALQEGEGGPAQAPRPRRLDGLRRPRLHEGDQGQGVGREVPTGEAPRRNGFTWTTWASARRRPGCRRSRWSQWRRSPRTAPRSRWAR